MDDPTHAPNPDRRFSGLPQGDAPWATVATETPLHEAPVAESGEIPAHPFPNEGGPFAPPHSPQPGLPMDGALVLVPAAVAAAAERPFQWGRVVEELVAWFKTLFSAAVYATLIVTFGFQVARVEGQSMAPTLEDQDRLIVNKLAYQIGDPQIGDVVMLYYPVDPSKSFVKRVVGEPNDTLRSVDGRVYRNDVPLPDDFIPEEFRSHDTWGPRVVPEGFYFVMGDHRNNSSDSRSWDYVPKKYIIGKVQIRWWPVTHAHYFEPWK
jgi:signal peptidase I